MPLVVAIVDISCLQLTNGKIICDRVYLITEIDQNKFKLRKFCLKFCFFSFSFRYERTLAQVQERVHTCGIAHKNQQKNDQSHLSHKNAELFLY